MPHLFPIFSMAHGSSQAQLSQRVLPLLLPALLFFLGPGKACAQSCLGLSPEPNSAGFEVGIEHQADGQRLGGWGHANVAGRIGVLGGASGGTLDPFARGGSEIRGFLSIGLRPAFPRSCLFAEYELEEESFRNGFGLNWGTYRERWTRYGIAVNGDLWKLAGTQVAWHVGPELVLREFRLKGRETFWEPEVYVLETTREKTAWHFGGRGVISIRNEHLFMILSVKNRPRVSSDLHWGLHLGFPI